MTGTEVQVLHIDHQPFSHVGPPPPSPPASVDRIDEEEEENVNHRRVLHAPRLTMPSQSEPPIIYDEPEAIGRGAKALHRASTDTRVPISTLRMPAQSPQPQPLPPPQPPPEPASRQDSASMAMEKNTPTTTTGTMIGGTGAPATPPHPSRRHTTGSPTKHHLQSQRLYQRFAPPPSPHHAHTPYYPQDDTAILGDAAQALQSDIDAQTEQIRRERQSKRAKAQAQAEAEAALTRTDTRGTRGTKDEMDDTKPLVGNLIGEDHVNYVLMYNMLTGIRIGVSRCQAKIKRPLTEEDFIARHKYSFDIVGNELTPSAKYDFKFKDYAPWVFRTLREDIFRLDPADYLLSLTAKYILSELGSPGKSGSFFYFSRDYRFIIKTIRHSEHKFLLSTLKQYYDHVKNNPHTLLSRFYGLHRVKLPRGKKIHFVIMNNLFPPHKDIHETYDLKGSTVGREYPEAKAEKNPRAGKTLELGPEKRALLAEQLRRDTEYLKSVDVMDYSLLVGVHSMKRGNRENVRRNTLRVFEPELPQGVQRVKQSARGTKTPEAIAMRRAMRASDPKALSSAAAAAAAAGNTSTASSGAANSVPVPGGILHAPTSITNAPTLTTSPSPSPNLFNAGSNTPTTTTSPTPPPHTTHFAVTSHDHDHHIVLPAEEEPGLFLDQDTPSDRRHFIFYQDEGGLQATDEENLPLATKESNDRGTIYYLGVIDILTPYGFVKRAEHYWKCCVLVSGGKGAGGAGYRDRRKKISQVEPREYGDRFVAFMKAIMRGGEGGGRFK
ncbi:hypothetical protein D9756_006799 [Leucocoprinus leucothites]|uniref:1-phosphatidylinositol-4-phosphate 5-kinase n=1 Tax=Leucocoprinus leucothites TaxID=201217 RepID=A0A8H5G2H1_9AGAR|nr:hypothetical protein D9756_006799 [Leucoagaricus leucothites]